MTDALGPTGRGDVTVLVNTTDSYEDCWRPFLTLFDRYWGDCPYPVMLATETRDFAWSRPPVEVYRLVQSGTPSDVTWSVKLDRTLAAIRTPFVLYMQEDYFLCAPVATRLVEHLVQRMENESIDCIQLVPSRHTPPWTRLDDELAVVGKGAMYRVNMQAGLWRVDALRSILRRHENPWQLEVWGSKRRVTNALRICAYAETHDDPRYGEMSAVIRYPLTGVVKGAWKREVVVPLFADEGIDVDFSRRGFYDERGSQVARKRLIARAWDRLRSL